MHLPLDLDSDFEKELQRIKKKYSFEYTKITGFKPAAMSFINYINEFTKASNVNDISVDGTSNSGKNDIVALLTDINKPILKLIAFNKIFKGIKKEFGLEEAKKWIKDEITGKSYLHDAHMASLIPYCYAYDLTRLAKEGLFFIKLPQSGNDLFDSETQTADIEPTASEPYNAEPARHLDVFINLVKEFVSWTCNRQSGAVGLANIIPYIYYFWLKDIETGYNGCHFDESGLTGVEDKDNIDDNNPNIKYLKQQIQALIYALNQPFLRSGQQCAFTNVNIYDRGYAHALFDGIEFPDGKFAYEHIENIINVQRVFLQVVANIRKKNMFTFPVLSVSLLTEDIPVTDTMEEQFENKEYAKLAKEYCKTHNLETFTKFKDEEFAKWASDHNQQYMDSNFFISDSITSLSNCCRLQSDITDLGYFNSIGGSSLSVGSIKVNTINLANIAYETITETKIDSISENIVKDYTDKLEEVYLNKLSTQAITNMQCLHVIRNILKENIKKGLLPNINDGLIELKQMYNTLGVIGVYEVLKSFQNSIDDVEAKISELALVDDTDFGDVNYIKTDDFGNVSYTERADKFVCKIFDKIRESISWFSSHYTTVDYKINIEQIPGETAASKLMQKDELSYPELVVKDLPLYGNQFIPLGIKATLEDRVKIAAKYDKYLNGGSICHINVDGQMTKEVAWDKLIWLAQQKLTYSAFTTKINVCKHNHAFFGNRCPECGGNIYTTYARIVGFYTPVSTYSTPRKQEYKMRLWDNM